MTTVESSAPAAAAQHHATEASFSQTLGAFIARTGFADLPDHVAELAKGRLLDALATGFSARRLPVPAIAQAFIASSSGPCTVLGSTTTRPAVDAAFVNGMLVNGCTHDDYIGKLHAGAVVVPAALAVAEERGASGADLLAGIVLGYDVGARAYLGGTAMHPRFRGTGVAGAVAATAAAAKLMGLSADQATHALGLSTIFASGTNEGCVAGTNDIKINVGWASRSGVSAALLACHGATATPTAFDGPAGFFAAFALSTADAAGATRGLGERWLIEDTSFKERPVCIFVQTPVQLARELALEHGLMTKTIDHVRLSVPLSSLNNPGHRNMAPFATQLQARISVRFTVAAALLGRPVEVYRYFDRFDDPEVLALMDRIDVDASIDESTVSIVVDAGGKRYTTTGKELDQLTPTLEKSIAKYDTLMADLPSPPVEAVKRMVLALERMPDVRELTASLRAMAA